MAMSLNEYIVSIINAPIDDTAKASAIVTAVLAAQRVTQSGVDATKAIDKIAALPTPEPVPAAPVPAPAPVAPPVAALTWTSYGGRRYDNVVPAGTPGTAVCPVTGHVLSLAMPANGETFIPYCGRVSKQAGSSMENWDRIAGAVMLMGADQNFKQFGGFKADGSNWHLAADLILNHAAYFPVDPAAEARRQAEWAEVNARLAQQRKDAGALPPAPTPPPTDVDIR